MKICYYRNYDPSVDTVVFCFWHEHPKRLSASSLRLNVCLSSTEWPSWLVRHFQGGYRHENCGVYVRAQIRTDTYLRKTRLWDRHACGHFRVSAASTFSPATVPPFLYYSYSVTVTCDNTCSGVWVRAHTFKTQV